MKAVFIATLLSFFFTLVASMPAGGINADRLSRGLSPLPPVRRHPTPVQVVQARSPKPSHVHQCNGGDVQCCKQTASSNDHMAKLVAGLLGAAIPANSVVGLTCSPLNVLGVGGGSKCNHQAVCCSNNNFNGVIALGCSPISLGA